MYFAKENSNTGTAYKLFPYLDFSHQNTKKHALCNRNPNTESTYNFHFWFLAFKTSKNMRFAMENTNTKTVYKSTQFPSLDFSQQNTKKYAYCDGKPEYGNCF